MKKIDISTKNHPNTFALVDSRNYAELNKYKWCVSEKRKTLYATRNIRVDGKQKTLPMHVVIIGKVEGKMTDHRDGDGLNNQRHNLRHCTYAENARNRGATIKNKSGYKGVHWDKQRNKWYAKINRSGKTVFLGRFTDLIKAAKCYDKAARIYHREFAKLNFPAGV